MIEILESNLSQGPKGVPTQVPLTRQVSSNPRVLPAVPFSFVVDYLSAMVKALGSFWNCFIALRPFILKMSFVYENHLSPKRPIHFFLTAIPYS